MKAVPISVPMIEPRPPMMTMARNRIERSMVKALVGDHFLVVRVERAADPGKEGRQAEREGAVRGQVDAHDLGGEVVVAHRDQARPVARAHQVGDAADSRPRPEGQDDVEILPVPAQRIAEHS